jgi:hypothetical protein
MTIAIPPIVSEIPAIWIKESCSPKKIQANRELMTGTTAITSIARRGPTMMKDWNRKRSPITRPMIEDNPSHIHCSRDAFNGIGVPKTIVWVIMRKIKAKLSLIRFKEDEPISLPAIEKNMEDKAHNKAAINAANSPIKFKSFKSMYLTTEYPRILKPNQWGKELWRNSQLQTD